MSDTQSSSEELPNWVCHPDDGLSHLTTHISDKDGFGGCPEHEIAGGSSIPESELQQLIASHLQSYTEEIRRELPEEKVGTEKMPLDAYERAYNIAVQDVNAALDRISTKWGVNKDE